jgi:hypothetical protein
MNQFDYDPQQVSYEPTDIKMQVSCNERGHQILTLQNFKPFSNTN